MKLTHELILPNDDIPFKMFLFEGKDGNYIREAHWHRSVEIFAVFEGELAFFLNEKRYLLKAGDFMIVNSNEVHSIHSPEKNHTVVLQIPLAVFQKYYTEEEFIYFTHSSRDYDKEVMTRLEDIYASYVKKEAGYELKVQGEFYLLLYLLVSRYRKTQVNDEIVRRNKGLDKLSEITGYIKDNHTKEISLEDLAKKFGYSPTYLSRMFRKYAKTTYKSYLDNIRLEYAFRDFANTHLPVWEVAMKHGFANSKSFAKIFHEKYGIMPSEYRKKDKKLP